MISGGLLTTPILHSALADAPALSVNTTSSSYTPTDGKLSRQSLVWSLPEKVDSPPHRSRPSSVHSTLAKLPSGSLALAVNSRDVPTLNLRVWEWSGDVVICGWLFATPILHVALTDSPSSSVNVTSSRYVPAESKSNSQSLVWSLPERMDWPPHCSRPSSVHSTDAKLPSGSLALAVNSCDCPILRLRVWEWLGDVS